MNIVERLSKVHGIDEASAKKIVNVFKTWQEIAEAEPETLVLIVGGLSENAAKAAVAFAKVMAKQPSAQAIVEVSVITDSSETLDPFAGMLTAGGVLKFDPEKAKVMAEVLLTYFWDVAAVNTTLHQILEKEGTSFVRNTQLADYLDTWLIKANVPGGGDMSVNGQQITVLPLGARRAVWQEVTEFLAESAFDRILRSAAVYRRATGQSKFADRLGGSVQVNLPSGVDDPDTIKASIEEMLVEMAQTLAGGRMASRARKMGAEYAYLLVPAMKSAEVIQSFGIPVGPGEDALTAFLTNKRNPQKRIQTGMELARVAHQALMHFATYDPQGDYGAFFSRLCEIGQQYCLAVDAFQKTSPQPVTVSEGQFVGIRQAMTSILAMINVKVTVGNTTVEVNASAGVQAVSRETIYLETKDKYGQLTGPAAALLREKMIASFDIVSLKLLASEMGQNLEAIVSTNNSLQQVAFEFINWAERHGSTQLLLDACMSRNPAFPNFVIATKAFASTTVVHTGGGAYIAGSGGVNTGGGDFTGRDKIIRH